MTSRLIGVKISDYLFEQEFLETSELALKIQNDFKLTLKESTYYVKNIMEIWKHLGELERVKEQTSKTQERDIISALEKIPTHQLSLERCKISLLEKGRNCCNWRRDFQQLR